MSCLGPACLSFENGCQRARLGLDRDCINNKRTTSPTLCHSQNLSTPCKWRPSRVRYHTVVHSSQSHCNTHCARLLFRLPYLTNRTLFEQQKLSLAPPQMPDAFRKVDSAPLHVLSPFIFTIGSQQYITLTSPALYTVPHHTTTTLDSRPSTLDSSSAASRTQAQSYRITCLNSHLGSACGSLRLTYTSIPGARLVLNTHLCRTLNSTSSQ